MRRNARQGPKCPVYDRTPGQYIATAAATAPSSAVTDQLNDRPCQIATAAQAAMDPWITADLDERDFAGRVLS